jgi:hypothetical protein
MTHRSILGIVLLTAGLAGCDKLSEKMPFLAKVPGFAKKQPPARPAPRAPAPTPPASPAAVQPDTMKKPLAKPKAVVRAAVVDEPWTPTDTGTIAPGMTREQVIAVWGPPAVERTHDKWTYLHFRNGCEDSCGTSDVVFLENGQVVDAIVRGEGHHYSGNSSSPPGRPIRPTPGNLTIPASTPPTSDTTPAAPKPGPGEKT